ncbi:MAG: DUF3078 domain-containing protein [bacterium]
MRWFQAWLVIFILLIGGECTNGQQAFPDSSAINRNPWNLSADVNVAQSQSAYSRNWDGEEEGTVAWTVSFNGSAEKQVQPKVNSRTTLKLEFGQTQTQDRQEETWSGPAKSVDNIDLESVLRYSAGIRIDPFVAARFQSQFTDIRGGREYSINPVIFTESVGLARSFWKRKDRHLIVRFGGAVRQRYDRNFLLDDSTGTRGAKTIHDAGIETVSELTTPMLKERVRANARLTVYQALYNSYAGELTGNAWKSADIDIEAIFTTRVTRLIAVNLNVRWLYDQEIDKAGRFKEFLTLGVAYSLL